MIHCDEVFDILTRGPFPTGAPSDGIVESHLNHCGACRQLAEALRPAIELLQEAIAPEESSGLPRYSGAEIHSPVPRPVGGWSGPNSAPLKTKLAPPRVRPATSPVRETTGGPWRSAAKFAAAACVGLALAGMLRQMALSGSALHRGLSRPAAAAAHWRLAEDGWQWAAKQQLAAPCRELVAGFTVAAAPLAAVNDKTPKIACCLGCHAARDNQFLSATRLGGFVRTCQACH